MIDYLITSFILLVIGVVFNLYHASKPRGKYGYRSKLALSTPERWHLAQRLSRRYFLLAGITCMGLSYLAFIAYPGNMTRLLSAIIPRSGFILIVRMIERKLKKEGPLT